MPERHAARSDPQVSLALPAGWWSIERDGSATHFGEPVLFRSVLLPLADDGTSIDHILCAINFRALRPGEDKQLRARLEVLMLKVEPGQLWDVYSPLLGGWVQAKGYRDRRKSCQVASKGGDADDDPQANRDDATPRTVSVRIVFVDLLRK
jgi:hypothetical protein